MATHLGRNGNGQIGKRINQMVQVMSELAIHERLVLAKKTILPLEHLIHVTWGPCLG